jgi:hypothetical protein
MLVLFKVRVRRHSRRPPIVEGEVSTPHRHRTEQQGENDAPYDPRPCRPSVSPHSQCLPSYLTHRHSCVFFLHALMIMSTTVLQLLCWPQGPVCGRVRRMMSTHDSSTHGTSSHFAFAMSLGGRRIDSGLRADRA